MKFPERLSKERLFLLSKEDRAIYEQEWKEKSVPKYVVMPDFSKIFEDEEIDEIAENKIVSEQLNVFYRDLYKDIIDEEEYVQIEKNIGEQLKNNFNKNSQVSVNEAVGQPGKDHLAWISSINLNWLGKLAVAGLGLLGTAIAYMASDIKHKLAMIKLKKYFNRLVEVVDCGTRKKRSFFSKMFNWKERGEHNIACFRTIQEAADRNMALSVMQAAKRLGYFAPGQMAQISSGEMPQEGGGLSEFNDKVLSKLNVLVPEDDTINIQTANN